MLRAFLIFLTLALISGPNLSLFAQEEEIDLADYLCPEDQQDINAGEEYTTLEDLPMVMMAGFVHINRNNAEREIDTGQGCLLAVVPLENDDQIMVLKFLDTSGEYASRYQFSLLSEMESGNVIALNTFRDMDAVAHELEFIPPEARLYHLDEFGPDFISTHMLFAGEPSVTQLLEYVIDILNGDSVAAITVDLSGEEATLVIREDLLDEEEAETQDQ